MLCPGSPTRHNFKAGNVEALNIESSFCLHAARVIPAPGERQLARELRHGARTGKNRLDPDWDERRCNAAPKRKFCCTERVLDSRGLRRSAPANRNGNRRMSTHFVQPCLTMLEEIRSKEKGWHVFSVCLRNLCASTHTRARVCV